MTHRVSGFTGRPGWRHQLSINAALWEAHLVNGLGLDREAGIWERYRRHNTLLSAVHQCLRGGWGDLTVVCLTHCVTPDIPQGTSSANPDAQKGPLLKHH